MAKKYSVRNITGGSMKNPAKPIILMTSSAKGAVGQSHLVVPPDDSPVTLSENEYNSCKGAIDKYVKANMFVLKVLDYEKSPEEEKKEKAPVEKTASEIKDDLETYAKETHGVDLDKRKSVETLQAEVAALDEKAKGGDED
jgi:hypothetical protein